jgi:hypothetical protein
LENEGLKRLRRKLPTWTTGHGELQTYSTRSEV